MKGSEENSFPPGNASHPIEEPKPIEDREVPEYVPRTMTKDIVELKTEIRENRERLERLKEENKNPDDIERYERIVEKGRERLQHIYKDAKREGDE